MLEKAIKQDSRAIGFSALPLLLNLYFKYKKS